MGAKGAKGEPRGAKWKPKGANEEPGQKSQKRHTSIEPFGPPFWLHVKVIWRVCDVMLWCVVSCCEAKNAILKKRSLATGCKLKSERTCEAK